MDNLKTTATMDITATHEAPAQESRGLAARKDATGAVMLFSLSMEVGCRPWSQRPPHPSFALPEPGQGDGLVRVVHNVVNKKF